MKWRRSRERFTMDRKRLDETTRSIKASRNRRICSSPRISQLVSFVQAYQANTEGDAWKDVNQHGIFRFETMPFQSGIVTATAKIANVPRIDLYCVSLYPLSRK
jgi:hypothetical protein